MTINLHAHPDLSQLQAFSLGKLQDEAVSAQIEDHLETCAECRQKLEAVASDTIESLVLAAATPPPFSVPGSTEPLSAELLGHPRYEIQGQIGSGGMGAVYKARHKLMHRDVAVKVVNRRLLDQPEAVERFRREVRAAARLSHPNIVTAHDAEEAGRDQLLVMEFVEGQSLAAVVGQSGPLTVSAACDYVRQAALGLQHAFERGMVHRDIKPNNLMLTPTGQVKILDFGLARLAREREGDGALTSESAILGTPDYIAPEQAEDSRQADIRADLYSLGCTLHFLLTGQPPFPNGTIMKKLMLHKSQPPQSVKELRADVPTEVAGVLDRLLAKDRAQRYQTPAELAAALEPFARPAPLPQPIAAPVEPLAPTLVPLEVLAPRKPRHGGLVALAAASVVLIGGLLLAQIIIRLTDEKGKVREIEVKPGEKIDIVETGVKPPVPAPPGDGAKPLPIDVKPEPLPAIKGGTPLSPLALVQNPAQIKGVRSWTIESIKGRRLMAVAHDPKGRWLATLAADGSIRLLDPTSGKLLRVLVGPVSPTQWNQEQSAHLAFSPDGRILATTTANDTSVTLWDAEAGKRLRIVDLAEGMPSRLAWSPDGSTLAVAVYHPDRNKQRIEFWDARTGKLQKPLPLTQDSVAIAWSPDGQKIAVGGSANFSEVHVYDVASQKLLRSFKVSSGAYTVCWSPDGKRVIAAADAVRCWDYETGKSVWEHAGTAVLTLSPDGKTLCSAGGDGKLVLLDAESGRLLRKVIEPYNPHVIPSWSSTGREIAAVNADHDRHLCLYEAASGELVKTVPAFNTNLALAEPAWSPDGKGLATPQAIWNVGEGKLQFAVPPDNRYHLAWTLDGKQVLVPGSLVDTTTGQVQPWEGGLGHSDGFRLSTVVHPKGKLVALGGHWPGTDVAYGVRICELATGKILHTLKIETEGEFGCAWSPDGKRLAIGTHKGAEIGDWENGKRLQTLQKTGDGGCGALAYSPDGKLLAAYYSGTSAVRVWNVEDGEVEQSLPGTQKHFCRFLWSADGKTLTTGDADGMRDHDISSGRMVRARKWPLGVPSPDRRFGTQMYLNTCLVWDLESGQRRLTLMNLPDDRWIAISPEGHYRGSRNVERELVYVVELDDGRQETLSADEFAKRFGWKNDADKVRLFSR